MKELILAIQFLTRIPIPISVETKEDSFGRSSLWFPAAGLLVGAFDAAVYGLASMLLDGIFPVLCAVLANVCITGALHVDGLADTCDGIFSARKRERMLEIMKDSRIGTNGAIAIVFDLMFRVAVLLSVDTKYIIGVLLIAPVISKTMLAFLLKISIYARAEGGMGGLFMGKQSWTRTLLAMLLGVAIAAFIMQWIGLAAFAAGMLAAVLLKAYISKKLLGMTGDTLGAASEVVELVVFLVCALIGRQLL